MKAWTAANANPVAVQAELCAFANWNASIWNQHPTMLRTTADWIAEEARHFNIPIVRLTPQQAQTNGRGVCQHKDLGAWGGNHSDCGPAFPMDQVLAWAKGTPVPKPPSSSESNVICTDPVTQGVWVVATKEGAVNAYDGAPYLGGTNNTKMNASKYPCVGISTWKDGYVLVLDWGDRGDGKSPDGGDRYRRYHFPRNGSERVTSGTY